MCVGVLFYLWGGVSHVNILLNLNFLVLSFFVLLFRFVWVFLLVLLFRLVAGVFLLLILGATIDLGWTGEDLWSVAAIQGYLVDRTLRPSPLFVFADGRPLRKAVLLQRMQQALASAGIHAGKYTGHSFRIGEATAAAAAGYEDSTMQTLGRWGSDSYQRYIRLRPEALAPINKRLVGGR